MNYNIVEGRVEPLAALCEEASATEYISGPAAQGYVEEEPLVDAGMASSSGWTTAVTLSTINRCRLSNTGSTL